MTVDSALHCEEEAARLSALDRYRLAEDAGQSHFEPPLALARALFQVPLAVVSLVDDDCVRFKACPEGFRREIARHGAPCALAIQDRDGLVVRDLAKDGRFDPAGYSLGARAPTFYAGVPLITGGGRAVGAFVLLDFKPRALSAGKRALLKGLAGMAMVALEAQVMEKTAEAEHILRLERERDLRHLATIDPLTRLVNRASFLALCEKEVSRSARHGHRLAALMLELSGLRQINERYGEAAGDLALVRFAECCEAVFRDEDITGRLDGAQFAAILPETDAAGAGAAIDRLREAVGGLRILHDKHCITLSFVAGLACDRCQGSHEAEQLLAKAGRALRAAKSRQTGKPTGVRLFTAN